MIIYKEGICKSEGLTAGQWTEKKKWVKLKRPFLNQVGLRGQDTFFVCKYAV